MRDYAEIAKAYAQQVVARKIPACRFVQLACKRHLDDLKQQRRRAFPHRFDAGKAARVCAFLELLPHTKGRWAVGANKLRLEPWQVFILCVVFGWLRKRDGLRRYRRAYVEVPRKNGKSQLAAGIALYMFAADEEFGAEVYSGATSEKQAWEVFRPAKQMAERTPDLLEAFGIGVNASNLNIIGNGSRFEPLIGKPGDGASPSCAVVDEYHEHPDDSLYDTMLTGMGAREQPLMFVITTAGSDTAGPCYALRGDVLRVLQGTVEDDELFGIVYTIDEGDDWTSEAALRKANPNYDVSVSGEFLRSQVRDAVNNSRRQNTVKTKHCNVWVTAREAFYNMEDWNRVADATLSPADFRGDPCFAGLDLASKIDLTAVMRVFRRTEEDGEDHFYVFTRCYVPSARVEEPTNNHYHGWVADGHLIATDGDIIDFERIRSDVLEFDEEHGIAQLGYDPYGATQLAQELEGYGITCVEVPQRVQHLSEPMKWIDALVRAKRLHHDGNPVLAWAIGNVTAKPDAKENVFPRKERPENKIDPAVALMTAMALALVAEVAAGSSYEEGITFA